jgi:2-phospho-L-lactate guanylyltransferase (CobY/MobA/RfbA family)
MSAMSRNQLRLTLLALPEQERRDLVHALLEHHISASSGCFMLLDILLLVCPAEALTDNIDMFQSESEREYE